MPGTLISVFGCRSKGIDRRQLRQLYRLVAKAYHPDLGGDDRSMARAAVAYRNRDVATLLVMLRRHRANRLVGRR